MKHIFGERQKEKASRMKSKQKLQPLEAQQIMVPGDPLLIRWQSAGGPLLADKMRLEKQSSAAGSLAVPLVVRW